MIVCHFLVAILLFNVKVEMMTLEKWASVDKPTVGTLVAVRFSEDGLIYRAKVGRVLGNLANDALAGFIG